MKSLNGKQKQQKAMFTKHSKDKHAATKDARRVKDSMKLSAKIPKSKESNKLLRPKGKKSKKSKRSDRTEDVTTVVGTTNQQNANSTAWINEQRVLIFSSRGMGCLARHVMKNLISLLPHSRTENKLDTKRHFDDFMVEIMEDKKCNKVLFFEMRKKRDLYMYAAASPDGPTIKFYVQNLHSMEELRLTGNCLRSSRPLLSFDKRFDQQSQPHLRLIKEMFVQCFGCPRNHPHSQPFIDHIFTFSLIDGRIWFRNYQIVDSKKGQLAEIGPRFCLQPIYIQEGLFGGPIIYKNKDYVSPNVVRRVQLLQQKHKGRMYGQRAQEEVKREKRVPKEWPAYNRNLADPIFKA